MKKIAAGAAAVLLLVAGCGSDGGKAPASSGPVTSAALRMSCQQWSGLTVGQQYDAVHAYIKKMLPPDPDRRAERSDAIRSAVNEGCAASPVVQPDQSATDVIGSLS